MTYSLLTVLVLGLKGFLQSFDVSMGLQPAYATGSKGMPDTTYSMERLPAKAWERCQNKSGAEQGFNYRPDGQKYSVNILHPGANERDNTSIRGGISQHPMIRREMQYSVTYDIRNEFSEEYSGRGKL